MNNSEGHIPEITDAEALPVPESSTQDEKFGAPQTRRQALKMLGTAIAGGALVKALDAVRQDSTDKENAIASEAREKQAFSKGQAEGGEIEKRFGKIAERAERDASKFILSIAERSSHIFGSGIADRDLKRIIEDMKDAFIREMETAEKSPESAKNFEKKANVFREKIYQLEIAINKILDIYRDIDDSIVIEPESDKPGAKKERKHLEKKRGGSEKALLKQQLGKLANKRLGEILGLPGPLGAREGDKDLPWKNPPEDENYKTIEKALGFWR